MSVRLSLNQDRYKNNNRRDEYYSDFNHTFMPHPNTGQINKKTNIDSVKMALRNLLLTNKYERVRNPDFGTNIRKYLFENFGGTIKQELQLEIENAVEKYEPRVNILGIYIEEIDANNQISIDIEFSVSNETETQNLELVLYRVR